MSVSSGQRVTKNLPSLPRKRAHRRVGLLDRNPALERDQPLAAAEALDLVERDPEPLALPFPRLLARRALLPAPLREACRAAHARLARLGVAPAPLDLAQHLRLLALRLLALLTQLRQPPRLLAPHLLDARAPRALGRLEPAPLEGVERLARGPRGLPPPARGRLHLAPLALAPLDLPQLHARARPLRARFRQGREHSLLSDVRAPPVLLQRRFRHRRQARRARAGAGAGGLCLSLVLEMAGSTRERRLLLLPLPCLPLISSVAGARLVADGRVGEGRLARQAGVPPRRRRRRRRRVENAAREEEPSSRPKPNPNPEAEAEPEPEPEGGGKRGKSLSDTSPTPAPAPAPIPVPAPSPGCCACACAFAGACGPSSLACSACSASSSERARAREPRCNASFSFSRSRRVCRETQLSPSHPSASSRRRYARMPPAVAVAVVVQVLLGGVEVLLGVVAAAAVLLGVVTPGAVSLELGTGTGCWARAWACALLLL